ncbi:MAG: type transport system permease protein [Chloroflexota bacterium]|nr:type transport system permease protein [Chloroflexota bacterium]
MTGLFPNALHVARREYLVRVRGRAFAITTALLAVAIAAVTMVPTILTAVGVAQPPQIAVDAQADDLPADPVIQLQVALAMASGNDPGGEGANRPRVTRAEDQGTAAQAVRDGELDALLTITRGDDGELAYEYFGSASPTNQTRQVVTAYAQQLTIADRLARAGIDSQETAEIFEPPEFIARPVDPGDASEADDFGGAFILAYAVVILTFMAILTYGNWVAQSVAEEKSGRVMELLITAATPRQLLIGKVLGTGAAGLTQYVAIVAAAIIGFLANGPVADALGVGGQAPISLPDVEPAMLVVFSAFFLLGFLLYSTLYAAAGSMVSRIEDVQQAVGPLIFLATAGYFASFAGLNDPDAGWVGVLSLVPFFSPYLMPARMLLTSIDMTEVLLALSLLAVSLVGALWLASRVYSAGVLLYGQRVGLRNVWRATRVSR